MNDSEVNDVPLAGQMTVNLSAGVLAKVEGQMTRLRASVPALRDFVTPASGAPQLPSSLPD